MLNCGLKSLEQMTAIKNVSMFSLIHLAKDNGLKLYFCKVEEDELLKVARPAIFHQKDHFVFIQNGEAMPKGEYDGYVLTPRALREPLPYALAKKITGRKSVGAILQPIAIGLASVVNPVLGAVVGAGFGGATAGGAFGDAGKGEWWRIGTGALSGATAAGSPVISALSAAAGEVPGAVKSGNWMTPVAAGLGQYGANVFAGGVGPGITQASNQGAGFLGQASGGFQGGVGALKSAATRLAGGQPTGSGVELAPGATSIPTPAGYKGTYTLPGIGNSVVGLPGKGPIGMGASATRLAGGAASTATGSSGGFGLGDALSGAAGLKLLGLGASTLMTPPKLESNVTENMSKAAQFLGNENYNALPTATRNQLEEYVNTPLDQLAQKFYAPDDKGLRQLEERKQKAVDQLMTTYSNYGQDPMTSSNAQRDLTEISRQYDQSIAEYEQQIQNNAMQQAIQFKQDILSKSMEQGQFDYNAAMELATYIGRDQEMKFALESKNYEMLQEVLAQILNL